MIIKKEDSVTTIICKQLSELIEVKNKAYGEAASEPPILLPELDSKSAILVRMSDKIKRIQTLLSYPEEESRDETLRDSVMDLAGYCILFLASE